MSEPNQPPDPWAEWRQANRWQGQLHKQAAHKALDIPEDMTVTANRTSNGMGWRELLAIGATLAGLLGVAKGLGFIGNQAPPLQPPAANVEVQPGAPPTVNISQPPPAYRLEVSTGQLPQ